MIDLTKKPFINLIKKEFPQGIILTITLKK
jgi:hypothetical protein